MPYNPAEDLEQYFAKVRRTREHLLEGKEADDFFHKIADMFGANLNRHYTISELRQLPESKYSLSDDLTKSRAKKYADIP